MMFLASLLKSLPLLASTAPFLCLIDDQCECPDIPCFPPPWKVSSLFSHRRAGRPAPALRTRLPRPLPVPALIITAGAPDLTAHALDLLLLGGADLAAVLQEEVVERQGARLVHHRVEVLLLLVSLVSWADDPEAEESLLHGAAHGEDGMVLPHAQHQVDRGRIDALDPLQVLADVSQVLLGEELQAQRAVRAVDLLEEVLDEDGELQGVRRVSEDLLDLPHRADSHLVPVHEGRLQLVEEVDRLQLRGVEVDLVEDDELEDVPGIIAVRPVQPSRRGLDN